MMASLRDAPSRPFRPLCPLRPTTILAPAGRGSGVSMFMLDTA